MADLTAEQWLQSVWMALRRIEDNLALPPAPLEMPEIRVAPPDLTAIVNAVQSLNGNGPTAAEIAAALADVLTPGRTDEDASVPLRQVAEALEKLDFRLQGMGTQAYGGGAVSFSPAGYQQLADAVQLSTTETVVAAVNATTSTVELGANRAARTAMTIYNEPGASVLYMKFGPGASLASYSNRLGPGDYWESSPPKYTGIVTGLWDGTTGRALVTEFIP